MKIAISAGRGGTRGLALGVKIDEVLRKTDKVAVWHLLTLALARTLPQDALRARRDMLWGQEVLVRCTL